MSSIETICVDAAPQKTSALNQVARFVSLIMRWSQTAKSRRQLSELTYAELKDIGVTPDQARREAARPFWDGPNIR
ncbi:MAG: DUF1127 domain-containing protein [Roseibium sp.]